MQTPAHQTEKDAAAIEADGLTCGYDGRVILEKIHFQVRTGEIFFIVGGSGCGKSTLLRNLIGIRQPMAGEVRFFGQPFEHQDSARRREVLKTFGVLYQSGALWTSLTLRENVMLPLEEHTPLRRREREELATLKLDQVGLRGFEDYYPAEISGGMQKRAGLARALALDPAIVFLDEPTAGLDPVTSRKMDDLLRHIRDTFGTTLAVVSHELASIYAIADRAIMLDAAAKGIIAEGSPRELAGPGADPRAQEFFRRGERSPV